MNESDMSNHSDKYSEKLNKHVSQAIHQTIMSFKNYTIMGTVFRLGASPQPGTKNSSHVVR